MVGSLSEGGAEKRMLSATQGTETQTECMLRIVPAIIVVKRSSKVDGVVQDGDHNSDKHLISWQRRGVHEPCEGRRRHRPVCLPPVSWQVQVPPVCSGTSSDFPSIQIRTGLRGDTVSHNRFVTKKIQHNHSRVGTVGTRTIDSLETARFRWVLCETPGCMRLAVTFHHFHSSLCGCCGHAFSKASDNATTSGEILQNRRGLAAGSASIQPKCVFGGGVVAVRYFPEAAAASCRPKTFTSIRHKHNTRKGKQQHTIKRKNKLNIVPKVHAHPSCYPHLLFRPNPFATSATTRCRLGDRPHLHSHFRAPVTFYR
jgi:hypothetical protein